MQINKFTSLESIVEGIYINAGYQSVDWGEVLYHVQRIIELIGINGSYINKITDGNPGNLPPLHVSDYKVELPIDLVYVNMIRDYNTKKSLIPSTDVFQQNPVLTSGNYKRQYDNVYPEQYHCITQDDIEDPQVRQQYFNYQTQFENEVFRNLETHAVNTGFPFGSYNYTYSINNNYIFTNVKEMDLELSYQAFPVDDNGIPLIPDNEYYKRAVEAYIQERIDYKLWRTGRLNDKIYQDSKQNYHWAIQSAKAHISMPDVNEMEVIKNTYGRLIVDMKAHQSNFMYNAQRERIWKQ